MNIENEKPKPILLGRHLLELGMEPGPVFGRILKPAFEAQLDGVFEDLDGALAWARERMKDVG
jgi:tRNA nucleotidyltransferase (CCA-adding enzyme)